METEALVLSHNPDELDCIVRRKLQVGAAQVVDSIVADDIGKLPDRNIAEALQRITGIAVPSGSNLQNLNLPLTPNGVVYSQNNKTIVERYVDLAHRLRLAARQNQGVGGQINHTAAQEIASNRP